MTDRVNQTTEDLDGWWQCARAGAEAKKVFDSDPRPVEEIANEIMNDFLDTAAEAREALKPQRSI